MKPTILMDLQDMKPEEARVLIAKDAIELLEADEVTALHGSYISTTGLYVTKDEQPVHEILSALTECSACALGTALVAAVRRFNKLDLRTLNGSRKVFSPDREPVVAYLEMFFPTEQLDLLETTYEGRQFAPNTANHSDHDRVCIDAYRDEIYQQAHRRSDDEDEVEKYMLLTLFKNIVDNNGTFVVPGIA